MEKNKVVPFIFYNKNCPLCSTLNNTIRFTDSFGELYSNISSIKDGVYKVKCTNCDREYILIWEDGKPAITDKYDTIREFEEEFIKNEKRDIDKLLIDL